MMATDRERCPVPGTEKPRRCTTDGAEMDGGEDWAHDGTFQPMKQPFTRRSTGATIRPLVTIQVRVRDLGWDRPASGQLPCVRQALKGGRRAPRAFGWSRQSMRGSRSTSRRLAPEGARDRGTDRVDGSAHDARSGSEGSGDAACGLPHRLELASGYGLQGASETLTRPRAPTVMSGTEACTSIARIRSSIRR